MTHPVARRALLTLSAAALAALPLVGATPADAGPSPASAPASALAGPPGRWDVISGTRPISSSTAPSLARTPDGRLHVLYTSEDGLGKDLIEARIPANGSGWDDRIVHTGFVTMNPATAVGLTSTGLMVVYGPLHADPPYSDGAVHAAFSDNTDASWSVSVTPAINDPHGYGATGIGGVALGDDTLVTAMTDGSAIKWAVGLGGTVNSFSQSHCCAYYATVVGDSANAAVAWQGNGGTADSTGTFARQIHSGLGAIVYKGPGSSTNTGSGHAASMNDHPTAAIQRKDGFTYLAYKVGYPAVNHIGLWKASAPSAASVPGSKNARNVALSVAPNGRMWVAWIADGGVIKAVRTSASGIRFGGVRTIAKPAGADALLSIYVEGSLGKADLIVNGGDGLYHTQVLPGLNFSASSTRWPAGTSKRVVFTVKDAGATISGAKVTAKGRSCTTSTEGTCAITFPAMSRGSFAATVTKASYAKGSLTLKVG